MSHVHEMLKLLATGRYEKGWLHFLEKFSDLVYSVVLQFENDPFLAEDCYLHICDQLSESSFKRLLQFKTTGEAEFSTWLTIVVRNLCIDWRRAEYGRIRPFTVVRELTKPAQLIFEYRFQKGMALHECFLALKANYPDLTEQQFSEINGHLNQRLSSQQHWRLEAAKRQRVSHKESAALLDRSMLDGALPEPGPETSAQLEQDSLVLNEAISQLKPMQRLVIHLRFQHELTLEEVAKIAGLDNLHTVRKLLDDALSVLGDLLKNKLDLKKNF